MESVLMPIAVSERPFCQRPGALSHVTDGDSFPVQPLLVGSVGPGRIEMDPGDEDCASATGSDVPGTRRHRVLRIHRHGAGLPPTWILPEAISEVPGHRKVTL